MSFVLIDSPEIWKGFLPLTFTRPLSGIRIGILTIREKWEKYLGSDVFYHTTDYLQHKFKPYGEKALVIYSHNCPDKELVSTLTALKPGEALYAKDEVIAFFGNAADAPKARSFKRVDYKGVVFQVKHIWDIFQKNAEALKSDFQLLTQGRSSQPLSKTVTVIGDASHVFLEKGAKAEACILNVTAGPVYLAEDAEMMEGCIVRGGFALGEHSALKMGAKVYGASTIGPHSKVGGEMSNSVIFGYSNKAHDGFLGNSVLGEWCNLGADTNNSNLKNNYSSVKLFSYEHNKQIDTGLQFCGLIMGDHSKSGINTMFNTGTVVGLGCNIYGGGFPPTHVPNFSWGGSEGLEPYKLEKLFETAERVYERRGLIFSEEEKSILKAVHKGN